MKITFGTFENGERKNERLFSISLLPEDTLYILNSPAGWFMTEPITHVQFHILQYPFPISKDRIFFEYGDGCYTFVSQTGFETNEDHLEWLVSHGRIPMLEATKPFGKEKILTLGYVEFKKEVA